MKVIKVGTSSQSRIAQACDRCRSKKIRCDGIRPTCSQCSNVGFECRTSDKLSRRAFPRGYTESLEERVRQLETEVRELKDLLDEKDEKIDMLSRMHGNHSHTTMRSPSVATSAHSPASASDGRKDAGAPAKEDTFRVQASPLLLGVENSDSYFMGPSSGRAFIGSYRPSYARTRSSRLPGWRSERCRYRPTIFLANKENRGFQAQDARKWQVMLGFQPGSISAYPGVPSLDTKNA